MTDLEKKLGYKDIRFYRSIARSELRKERATSAAALPQAAPAQGGGGWLGWVWGGHKNESHEHAGPEGGAPGALNEEQRKELYRAIDWDEKDAVAQGAEVPREAMMLRVKAKLETGSFALRKDAQTDLVSMNFDDLTLDLVQRPDNFDATLALGGLRVFDGTCEGSVHKQVVRVKEVKVKEREKKIKEKGKRKSLPPPEEREADDDVGQYDEEEEEIGSPEALSSSDDDDDDDSDSPKMTTTPDPFFSLKFEHNPLDERADNALAVRLRHMEIIYHRGYVEAIVQFFKPPESQLESVGALIDVASSTLEGIRKETRAGLEYALAQHKTVDLHLDLNAVSFSHLPTWSTVLQADLFLRS